MRTIITTTPPLSESTPFSITGIKADTLTQLQTLGLQVPEWMVIPSTIFSEYVPESIRDHCASDIVPFIRKITLDSSLITSIHSWVHNNGLDNELFAVRSSICIDRSLDHTFAGQLKTNLCVPLNELPEAIIDVWTSPFYPKAAAYRAQWGISQNSIQIAVVIQKMVNSESSGIAMCFDPSNGSRSNIVISSCYGINTGITTTRTDCDQFTVNFSGKKASRISRVYEKKNRVIPDQLSGSGTAPGPVPYSMRSKSSLSPEQVMALATITRATSIKTGKPQILDWTFSKGTFYVLQARAVNSLKNIPDTTEKKQIWQRPASSLFTTGRTPPLTYSILKKITAEAFKSLCNRPDIKKHSKSTESSFDFLTYTNSHMYIDKSVHDRLVELLPFGSLCTKKTKTISLSDAAHSHLMLHSDYCTVNKGCKTFSENIDKEIVPSGKSFFDYSFQELLGLYLQIECQLSLLWKSLIINEHYLNALHALQMNKGETGTAFFDIFLKLNPPQNKNVLPDEIAVISAIATSIKQNQSAQDLFEHSSNTEIRKCLGLDAAIPPAAKDMAYLTIRKRILEVADGSSCSLKEITEFDNNSSYLNTIIDIIRLYLKHPFVCNSVFESNTSSVMAAKQKHLSLNGSFHVRYCNAMMYKLITQQQTLNKIKKVQFTRLKKVVHLLGKKSYSEGILENVEDIRFLTRDEIKDYISGQSITGSLKQMVTLRKQEYINSEKLVAPDLVFTHGIAYNMLPSTTVQSNNNQKILLFQGFGNQMGSVTGEVVLAGTTKNSSSIKDSILVVQDCSSKWILCLPFIKGIILENSSTLSELSLACHQLSIPLVFSPNRYCGKFNNGDSVELDSLTGKITIMNRASTPQDISCK
ncbi:MAG: hypothetical protein JW915_24755 [Chitinispirillaceae bacterium]|nr:hypothetical protein [Chitinispirillaceae bacterium]